MGKTVTSGRFHSFQGRMVDSRQKGRGEQRSGGREGWRWERRRKGEEKRREGGEGGNDLMTVLKIYMKGGGGSR